MDGVFILLAALANRIGKNRWGVVVEGLGGILLGIVTFFWPGITNAALLYLIAAWSILTGIGVILGVFQAREESAYEHQWLLGLISLILTSFGVVIAFLPGNGERTIIGVIAAFAILVGIVLVAFGLRLRSWNRINAHLALH